MKRATTIITLALALIMLAAVLSGCSTAQAAAEKSPMIHVLTAVHESHVLR